MKAAGWFSLSLVCPRDGLAGVRGHSRLFSQGKLPWWQVGDKINVSIRRLAAAQSKVPLCGTWHHTIDDTDLIKLKKKTAAHQWVSEATVDKNVWQCECLRVTVRVCTQQRNPVHRWKWCRQAQKAVWLSTFMANKVIMQSAPDPLSIP